MNAPELRKRSMVEEVESLTGMVFEGLTAREIKGAILALEGLAAMTQGQLDADEDGKISEAIVAEHLILRGDYKDGKGELPEVGS